MKEVIVLKNSPRLEFQLCEDGFQLIDEQVKTNNGRYSYAELEAVELNKVWFIKLANWLRASTWVLNGGVPYFPDAKTYKKANIGIQLKGKRLGMWLTDTTMANRARRLKQLLDNRT